MPCQPRQAVRPGQHAGRRRPHARRCRLQPHHPARAGPGASEPATGTRSGVTDHHASHAQPAPHASRRVPGRLGRPLWVAAQRAAGRGSFASPRARRHRERGHPYSRATATPATPPAPSAGVACYRPVGTPVTITSAAVSSVTTNRNQPGPAWHVFVVAFPTAEVPALTALIRQAYDSGDAVGMSVAGKLWQAPQPRRRFNALRAEQINLLSRTQARQLYRLLVPAG